MLIALQFGVQKLALWCWRIGTDCLLVLYQQAIFSFVFVQKKKVVISFLSKSPTWSVVALCMSLAVQMNNGGMRTQWDAESRDGHTTHSPHKGQVCEEEHNIPARISHLWHIWLDRFSLFSPPPFSDTCSNHKTVWFTRLKLCVLIRSTMPPDHNYDPIITSKKSTSGHAYRFNVTLFSHLQCKKTLADTLAMILHAAFTAMRHVSTPKEPTIYKEHPSLYTRQWNKFISKAFLPMSLIRGEQSRLHEKPGLCIAPNNTLMRMLTCHLCAQNCKDRHYTCGSWSMHGNHFAA